MRRKWTTLFIILTAGLALLKLQPFSFAGTTLHLAGDSTMAVQLASRQPMSGWGESLASMLCEDIRLINHARNGHSTRSFLSEGYWKRLMESLKSQDVVLIQFGHNDQKKTKTTLYAHAWRDYQDNLQRFINDVKRRHATPILLTPIVRRSFDSEARLQRTHGNYPAAIKMLAAETQVQLIDANKATYDLVDSMGPERSKSLFLHLPPDSHENYANGIQDDTHLRSAGATIIAELIADQLNELRPGLICR